MSVTEPKKLPYTFAKRHGVLAQEWKDHSVVIAHLANASHHALLETRRFIDLPITLNAVDAEEFEYLLQKTYEQGTGEAQEMVANMSEDLDLTDIAQQMPEPEDLLENADEAPIIRLINALLAEAVKEDASDIHIESYEDRVVVRLRVDGVLREVLQPQRALGPILISRIKVMAKLDIAEKRLPQDGRISLKVGGRAVDVRVSTLPSSHGERVVLRILDKQAGRLDLAHLGMPKIELALITQLIKKPHGIILVTGPTGSGKTTSLYAMLSSLNDRSRNIITVEDPIEYYLDGIGQTQVNSKINMTFARGLRAILRQDPDIVMVGEIRDLETAEIAVQASLTGHLVLSTLHTNTAAGAINRLRDMGIEPFMLSSSLIGVVAQRLVRTLCPDCKSSYLASNSDKLILNITGQKDTLIYRPVGCVECNHLGYKGRSGIYEIIEVSDTIREMIHTHASELQLEQEARKNSRGIEEVCREKVMNGETTIEEMVRVTRAQ